MGGELLAGECGIAVSGSAVGRVLRRRGVSPQRPWWRAWQAAPEAVRRWKDTELPALRAAAQAEGATVSFADEAGIRSADHAGTTGAPVGKAPVVTASGARHHRNMISAVTGPGLRRFAACAGSFTAATFSDFCRELVVDTARTTGRGVYRIVDGHPTHKATEVKEVVAAPRGRRTLFILPGYAPQLNPDEWVGKHVKYDRVGRTSVHSGEDFIALVRAALRRIQRRPALVRAFFADPDLAYITG